MLLGKNLRASTAAVAAGFLVTFCQICSAVPSPGKDGDVAPLVPSASIDINNDFKLYDETQHIPAELLPLEHRGASSEDRPVRAKREGFVDFSAIPEMMMDMISSFGHGLSTMMGYSHQVTTHMVNGLQSAVGKRPPYVAAPLSSSGGGYNSNPKPAKKPTSYKKPPKVFYGSWKPIISTSYNPPPPKPTYVQPTHQAPVQYVPASPSDTPLLYDPPSVAPSPPPIQYVPAAKPESDSYGTPVAEPVTQPPYQPPVTQPPYTQATAASHEEVTEEPYQTSYEPASTTAASATSPPLHGSFAEVHEALTGGHDKGKEDHGHKKEHVPEYSSDKDHVNHIASNTLFYKDTKNIKFQQKPDGHSHDREVSIDAGKFDFVQAHEPKPGRLSHLPAKHHAKKSIRPSAFRNPFLIPRIKGRFRRKKVQKVLPGVLQDLFI